MSVVEFGGGGGGEVIVVLGITGLADALTHSLLLGAIIDRKRVWIPS